MNNRYFYLKDIDCVITVEYASRKELLELLDNHIECCKRHDEMVANGNPDAKFWDNSEEVFMILYKDGTTDYIDGDYDGHKIRRQHIASIVECNPETYMVYGNFEMNEAGVAYPAFEDAIDESLKEVDSEDYTESATEQAEEQTTPTSEPEEQEAAETETAQKQNIKENPEIKAMLNDTYSDYHGNPCTVSPEQLEKFKNLVTEIKQILSCDTEIVNGNLDSLPENKKACVNGINIERELIIIDNFYIDMMEYEGTEKVIETICHEIAHNRYWNHTKWHRQLTKEYYEKVMDYLTKQTETAETEQEAETKNTYEHAVEMAKYAASMGDGVQAIYFKDGKFKAGLESDRQYAEKNGWQYFHTVSETIPQEERTRAEKWEEIKEARKKSLFWAKRMCYKSADYHPEWKEEYEKAKQNVEEVKAKYEETA